MHLLSKWKTGALAVLLVAAFASQAFAYPSVYVTGTVRYDPAKAWNGYTLAPGADQQFILIDMNGNAVKEWTKNNLGVFFRPMPDGGMINMRGTWAGGQQDAYAVSHVSFDEKITWEFRKWQQVDAIPGEPEENGKTWISRGHHDHNIYGYPVYYTPGRKFENKGKILILAHINETRPEINKNVKLLSEAIYEVDMKSGEVIWKWYPGEHFAELGFDEDAVKAMQSYPPSDNPQASRWKADPSKPGMGFDWLHLNTVNYLGPNKWFDSGDKRFHPDNIIINSRDANFFCIIDHESGKVVWRVGPDFGPDKPEFKLGQMIGMHDVHMIPPGLPGEGNILVFDNGGTAGYGKPSPMVPVSGFMNARRDYSRIVEFNPQTLEIVWEYDFYKNPITKRYLLGHYAHRFYSPFCSNVQRLPNGNTHITEADSLRLMEVTKDYETVWEYVSPYAWDSPRHPLVFRSYRIPYDWVPQLKNKPREVAVIPPANHMMQIPNVEGKMPVVRTVGPASIKIGTGKPVDAAGSLATVAKPKPADAAKPAPAKAAPAKPAKPGKKGEEDAPGNMHTY